MEDNYHTLLLGQRQIFRFDKYGFVLRSAGQKRSFGHFYECVTTVFPDADVDQLPSTVCTCYDSDDVRDALANCPDDESMRAVIGFV